MDCMHELPVVYYNTKNDSFTSSIFIDWFFKHFVHEVRHYEENVLHIAPESSSSLR